MLVAPSIMAENKIAALYIRVACEDNNYVEWQEKMLRVP